MSDDSTATGAAATQAATSSIVIIAPELRQSFPDLVDLVMQSESMNDGERQYWFDLLPMMTPDQVQQLREILLNEKSQLAAIDAKYAEEIKKTGTANIEATSEARQQKRQELSSQEEAVRNTEEEVAEDLLKQME